ncbi:MAG: hydrogenase maturation protease [Candidatus Margulisbacteria bacterium]|nr:hydrogenase maturation protease [Candidatus Margulisiibacteriota bacterium]
MNKKVLVLGVGNALRRDDGVGPEVIKFLQDEKSDKTDFLDGGTDGLSLLDVLKEYKKAILIDAVDMKMVPGEVRIFTPEEAKLKIKTESLSTHGIGLAEVIGLMQQLEIKTELKIIGVQPENIDFGEGLSETVLSKLPEIIKIVKGEIE